MGVQALRPKLDPAMPPSTADLLDKRLRHMERQLAHLHGQNFGQQLTATQWRAEQVGRLSPECNLVCCCACTNMSSPLQCTLLHSRASAE